MEAFKKILRVSAIILATAVYFFLLLVGTALIRTGGPEAPWLSVFTNKPDCPEGTVYVDLLYPIPADHEAYVECNTSNADLYDFAYDSEIVTYCDEQGFVSYTFHVTDAYSNLEPKSDGNVSNDGTIEYVCLEYNIDPDGSGRDSSYDRYYCKKEFKYAKFAYLDENGDIIGVTNSEKIHYPLASAIDWKLEGLDFSVTPEYQRLIFFSVGAVLYIVVATICIINYKRK